MADITKINLNGTNYNLVDSAATSAIASEVSRAQGAESAITSALSAEVVARQSADTALEQAIAAKADSASTYTKTEVDTALAGKANTATTYTKSEVDTALAGKANTATTYTKSEVDTALAGKQNTLSAGTGIQISGDVISCTVDTGLYVVVQTLPAQPAAGNENKIHLVPLASGETQNMYAEYIWKGDAWEKLGEKQIDTDLTDYWTSAQTQSAITNATSGKVDTSALTNYYTSAQTDSAITSALTDYWTSAQTEGEFQGAIGVSLLDYDTVQEVLSNAGVISVEGESGTEPGELTVNTVVTDLMANAEYNAQTETLILNLPAPPSE